MPTWKSLEAFGRELVGVERDLTGPERRQITRAMGKEAEHIAATAARRDLGGDRKFTNWAPVSDTRLRPGRDGSTILTPTRSGAGVWTVAERGRNQGNVGLFQGPGVNVRTGLTSRTKAGNIRKVRARRARRWNGVTQGKGTATEAVKQMERKLAQIADKGVRAALRKRFDVT